MKTLRRSSTFVKLQASVIAVIVVFYMLLSKTLQDGYFYAGELLVLIFNLITIVGGFKLIIANPIATTILSQERNMDNQWKKR